MSKLNVPWRVEKTTTARPSDRRVQILDSHGNLVCEMAGTSKRDVRIAEIVCLALNREKFAADMSMIGPQQ